MEASKQGEPTTYAQGEYWVKDIVSKGNLPPEYILEGLVAAIRKGVAVVDRNGFFLYVNEIASNMLQRTPKEIVGRNIQELFSPEDAVCLLGLVQRALEQGKPVIDESYIDIKGALRWYRTRIEPLREQETVPAAVLILTSDHTEKRTLQERARFFQTVVEPANYGVGAIDSNDTLIYVNRAFAKMHGYEPEELIGKHVSILHTQEQMAEVNRINETIKRNMAFAVEEVWHKRKDGSVFPTLMSISAMRDEENNIKGITATAMDITVQKNIETALRASEERFRALWRSIPVPTYIWRKVGNDFILSSFNDAGVEMTHGGIRRLVGISLHHLYADRPDIVADIERCYREQSTFSRRMDYQLRSTGEMKYLDVHYAFVSPDSVLLHTVDITSLVKAEKELRLSEKRYSTLVEYAPYGIAVVDAKSGKFVDANGVAARLFGLNRSQLLEYGPLDLSPETQPDGRKSSDVARSHMRAALSGKPVRFEWVHRKITGEEFQCEILMTRMPEMEHKHVRVTIVDVTERKRQEELLVEHQMAMIAASRLSALGTMAANIAHEINNPLATISAACEQLEDFLRAGVLDSEHAGRLAGHIRRNVGRIERIVRGLRALSREGLSEPFSPVSLRDLILDTIDLCSTRFKAYGVALRFVAPEDAMEVQGRETQIAQVLINLLNNAFDAAVGRKGAWVEVRLERSGEWVEISVSDSGPGVPAEMTQKIFDAFFTTKSTQKGTGLGLSISKTLVEKHDGQLFLDTQSPNTRFVVRLPRKQHRTAKQKGS